MIPFIVSIFICIVKRSLDKDKNNNIILNKFANKWNSSVFFFISETQMLIRSS